MRKPLLTLAALVLALFPLLTLAQEPPTAREPASDPLPVPTIVNNADTGQREAVVPLPDNLNQGDAQALANQAQQTSQAVGSGDVSVLEATRDPWRAVLDLGNSLTFWVLTVFIFGPIIRPISQIAVNRVDKIDNRLGGAVSAAAVVVFFTLAWLLFRSDPDLPQTWVTWVAAGGVGVGLIGAPAQSLGRTIAGRLRGITAPDQPEEP